MALSVMPVLNPVLKYDDMGGGGKKSPVLPSGHIFQALVSWDNNNNIQKPQPHLQVEIFIPWQSHFMFAFHAKQHKNVISTRLLSADVSVDTLGDCLNQT